MNENYLEGMRCPRCGSEEPFNIGVNAMVEMCDDGGCDFVDGCDLRWDDDSDCVCPKCEYSASVGDFKKSEIGPTLRRSA
jgi:hypothetical protein